MLKDLGHFHGKPNNQDDLDSQNAFKAFQNKSKLPETGKEDSATRKALFTAYMNGKHDIKIGADRFRKVAGNAWMGCGANNHAKEGEASAPENRRVAFILVPESKYFPVNFPCQDGSEGACAGQCKKAGKRSTAGVKCAFYDELVREEKQAPAAESGKTEDDSGKYDRIGFKGYEGKGYVIKDFKKYQGSAIQLNPEKILPIGSAFPAGFNNQCVSFVRFFGLPQTSSWKKGPRVCDLEPGEVPEGTVVATLRDGIYYSDTSGRSHVGIYLSHDDYKSYLSSKNGQAGVHMVDQYATVPIDTRTKQYCKEADEESKKKSKKEWTDSVGKSHDHRVQWVDDGEEYYVLLTAE